MVEKQVKVEILAIDNHPFLPLDEGESIAQLQYKLLQMCHQAILKAFLAVHSLQSSKFQKIRTLEDKVGGEDVVLPQFR